MNTTVRIYIIFTFILLSALTASGQSSLPDPELVFIGKQDAQSAYGEQTTYWLGVSNRSAYPDEMVAAAPELPPCGRNKEAARSWIDIFGKNGRRIYGFCALKSAEELNKLGFNLPKATNLKSVYIVITDRKTGSKYKSNSVDLD